jgi:thioredoxin-related protein
LAAALILAVVAIAFLIQPKHPQVPSSAQKGGGLASPTAAEDKRPIVGKVAMLDFYTDWCGWCKKLDEDVYPNPRVQKAMKPFDFRRVNAEGSDADRALAKKYSVDGYPTIVFVDSTGAVVHRIVGYLPPADFEKELAGVSARAKSK